MRSLLICAVLASLAILTGCSKKSDEGEKAEAPAPVQVTSVTQETIRRVVEADGVLFPQNQASVVPKISAPVQRFMVNRGDRVRAGQVLATLENRDLAASVAESRGQLAQAESNYRNTASATVPEEVTKAQTDVQAAQQTMEAAQKLLENRQNLLKEGAIARKLVDDAQVAYVQAKSQFDAAQEHLRALQSVGKEEQVKTAQAQVETARGHLQSAEAQVGYSEVRSPIDGVIADRPLYAGEMASAGTPLLTVMDVSRVVARVNVPQSQASAIAAGQTATISQTGDSQKLEGKVTIVSPATDPNSTTIQVWVMADNPGGRFKPGAAVHAAIVTQTIRNASVVPASAILPGEEGGTAVLTVSPDSTAHLRPVETGVRYGDKVQIINGVNPGDEVVVVGGLGVEDKAKVKIVGAEEKEDEDEDEAPAPANAKDAKKDEAKTKGK
ncbi:MAG: efflux RND transporter periplasmic adaptor subunit [Terriglobia bacterium]|nr:MAG: efflux RND transporter periplasmic adaptor subunit [Terriglobia bacterium]